MKIAIDAHSLGSQAGGNETYFRQLLSGLAQEPSGNQYSIFYMNDSTPNEITGDDRFHLVRIPHNPIHRICAAMPRLLHQARADVFHCQYFLPPFLRGIKTVVAIHDLAYEHFPEYFDPKARAIMKTLVRWAARHADHILTISEFSAMDIAERYGVPREKITVAYLAASSEFHPRVKDDCREHLARSYGIDFPYILYVGRIQARKNLPRLVEAYSRLLKQGLPAKLVLVGKKDWQFQLLVEKIKALGVEASVVFPGYVPRGDLPLFYNAAELFVFPSFFEGFGLPVIESMSSGTPTITSVGSSLEEVAGDAALLVDPRDTASIQKSLEKVLESTQLQQDLAIRGLQRSAQFKREALADKALGVYRKLADAA